MEREQSQRILTALAVIICLTAPLTAAWAAYPFGLGAPKVLPTSSSFSANPSQLDMGSVRVGQYSANMSLTLTNPSSSAYSAWTVAEDPNTAKIELDVSAPAGFGYTRSNSITFVEASSGLNSVPGKGSLTLTIRIKPLFSGTYAGWLVFGEGNGNDVYVAYQVTGTLPPPPVPDKPGVSFDKGTETVGADGSINVRFLFGWKVIVPTNIKWDFGDGSTAAQEPGTQPSHISANPSHIYAVAGTYKVRVEATDQASGKVYPSEREVVFPTPEPEATITPAAPEPWRVSTPAQWQTSVRVTTSTKVAGTAEMPVDEWRARWKRPRAKPAAAIQETSWGEVKNKQF